MKKNRMLIDLTMTVLLPMLMAYSLIGETFHEIAGTLMLVLFIAHNWLNRGFWKNIFTPKRAGKSSGGRFDRKGKYNSQRIFRTVVNVALLVMMILQPLSGIAMSRHLYTFIPVLGISATARQIHLVLAYWCLCLMSLHAGTHLDMMFRKMKKKNVNTATVLPAVFGVISVYGIYAFIKRQLADYMFMKTPFVFFDFSEARVYFFLDYIAIMILFMMVGFLIVSVFGKIGKKSRKRFSIEQ